MGNQEISTVALFLVDQRMPQMTGIEFLEKARAIFPESKKVLLTAYADTEAAINSINKVGLDYYLLKPWDPPQDRLYPILDDLLAEWQANARLPYEGIRVAGTLWSQACHEVKEFLARYQILLDTKTIAVVGMSTQPDRPSHDVPRYLKEHGYRIIPVNPHATEILGEKA